MSNTKFSPKYIAVIAMFTALAFVSVVVSKVIPNVAGFLSYEPKDSIIAIAGFIFGPLSSVLISVLVSFIEMVTISTSGPIGFLMNVIATCAFVLPATVVYKKNRTRKGAFIGLCLGVIGMTICMLLWNYILTPLYMKVDRAVVVGMLVPVFLPFNLIKGGINAGITLLLYKPIVTALRKARLVEPSKEGSAKAGFNVGFFLVSLAVLVTCVLAFLVMIGVI
jgi:riboflavin transporter FmnP